MRGCNTNYLSSNNSTERSSTWYSSIDETFINNLCEMSAIKLLPSSYSIRLVPAWLQTEAQSTGRRQKSTPFPLVSGLSTIHLGSLHVYLSGVSTIHLGNLQCVYIFVWALNNTPGWVVCMYICLGSQQYTCPSISDLSRDMT